MRRFFFSDIPNNEGGIFSFLELKFKCKCILTVVFLTFSNPSLGRFASNHAVASFVLVSGSVHVCCFAATG